MQWIVTIVTLQPGASRRDTSHQLPGAGGVAQAPGQQEAGAAGGHVGTPRTGAAAGGHLGNPLHRRLVRGLGSTHPGRARLGSDLGQTAAVTASPGPQPAAEENKDKNSI